MVSYIVIIVTFRLQLKSVLQYLWKSKNGWEQIKAKLKGKLLVQSVMTNQEIMQLSGLNVLAEDGLVQPIRYTNQSKNSNFKPYRVDEIMVKK